MGKKEESKTIKKVTFLVGGQPKIKYIYHWLYAHREARKSVNWEQMAVDHYRFQRRISQLESIISPVLDPVHRCAVYEAREFQYKVNDLIH